MCTLCRPRGRWPRDSPPPVGMLLGIQWLLSARVGAQDTGWGCAWTHFLGWCTFATQGPHPTTGPGSPSTQPGPFPLPTQTLAPSHSFGGCLSNFFPDGPFSQRTGACQELLVGLCQRPWDRGIGRGHLQIWGFERENAGEKRQIQISINYLSCTVLLFITSSGLFPEAKLKD